MDKRGQIYVIAIIILAVILFSLSSIVNEVQQEKLENDFEKLASNYEKEATKVVNNLLSENADVVSSFSNFTILFTSYSKSQNPDFGLIYALDFNETIKIGNFLKQAISIYNGVDFVELEGCFDRVSATLRFQGLSLSSDVIAEDIIECEATIPSMETIGVVIAGDIYQLDIMPNRPNLMIVSRAEVEEQRQVFSRGVVDEDPTVPSLFTICGSLGEECTMSDSACRLFDGACAPKCRQRGLDECTIDDNCCIEDEVCRDECREREPPRQPENIPRRRARD